MTGKKAFATVAVAVTLFCAILAYSSASDQAAGLLLTLAPPARTVSMVDTFISPPLSPTPTDGAFTSPLPPPTATYDTFISPLPSPTATSTPTSDPFISPLTTPDLTTVPPTPTGTRSPSSTPAGSPVPKPTASGTPGPTGSPTPTCTPSPTATRNCPRATAEPLWVDPLTSPTDGLSQTITVYAGNSEAVTITLESGLFAVRGDFGSWHPALVNVDLLADTTHHLRVYSKVKRVEYDTCVYGGYTLSTTKDRYGTPLIIVQQSSREPAHSIWLPVLVRNHSLWLPLLLQNHGLLRPAPFHFLSERECSCPGDCEN